MNNTINYNQSTEDWYSTIQMKLPVEIGIKINLTDPVVTFKEVMGGVNLNLDSKESRESDGYDPRSLLKIVLFAFMINERSTRKIESLCRNDIRFMYLMGRNSIKYPRILSKKIKIKEQKKNINEKVVRLSI